MRIRSRAGMLGLVAALAACGGSGGGGGGGLSDADFVGAYFYVSLGGRGAPATNHGGTGSFTSDGSGSTSASLTSNNLGVVFGPSAFTFEVDVAGDGSCDLRSGGSVFARGGLTSDGSCALFGSVPPGPAPRLSALLRRGGTYDVTSLAGTYHLAGLFAAATGESRSAFGDGTFDGAGNGSFPLTFNAMGLLSFGTGTFAYTVAADGTSTLTAAPAVLPGGVVEGGSVAVWGGGVTAGEGPGLLAVVKAATAADLATLRGAYWVARVRRVPSTGEYASDMGTATADGAGAVSLLLATNLDAAPVAASPVAATYTVAANGGLTLVTPTVTLVGGVTADGRFAVLGGGTTAASEPTLCFFARK